MPHMASTSYQNVRPASARAARGPRRGAEARLQSARGTTPTVLGEERKAGDVQQGPPWRSEVKSSPTQSQTHRTPHPPQEGRKRE
eukprot:CAMPEP_0196596360 /NCGR_PEP_ID=MMETSP1081-20130531/85645_1 /TAXON_ID=36882 /ORGANISM="Pyramimonas amylifera, Strain CCMP720" /LENGTH=84 /DNA_ID=CAMNT_0041921325 /DNA_START=11 /DNA_END=262 /DNA_ORIENTATION=+